MYVTRTDMHIILTCFMIQFHVKCVCCDNVSGFQCTFPEFSYENFWNICKGSAIPMFMRQLNLNLCADQKGSQYCSTSPQFCVCLQRMGVCGWLFLHVWKGTWVHVHAGADGGPWLTSGILLSSTSKSSTLRQGLSMKHQIMGRSWHLLGFLGIWTLILMLAR